MTRRDLASAVAGGGVTRAARGVYACTHLDPDAMVALRAGCAIDCISALRRSGVWSGMELGLHVRAQPNQHVRATNATVHWARQHDVGGLEVSPLDALLQAMHCLDEYHALAAVESALHLEYLPDLHRLVALAPQRMQRTLRRLDRGAQSGLETIVRLRLADAGHQVRTQVRVAGWPIDVLVDERVGVETDGRIWHSDRFITDRTRDIALEAAGIRTLRIANTHVFDTWDRTLAAIQRMVIDAS